MCIHSRKNNVFFHHATHNFNLPTDLYRIEPNQHAKYVGQRSFRSHTHQTDCSIWTTKGVGKHHNLRPVEPVKFRSLLAVFKAILDQGRSVDPRSISAVFYHGKSKVTAPQDYCCCRHQLVVEDGIFGPESQIFARPTAES